jgi:hypothetical protein
MNNPHFIVAGERRSGSTTLYELLKQHSGVDLFPVADMDYFIKPELFQARNWVVDFDNQDEWQASHSKLAYADLFRGLDFSKKVGQKDADLLFWRKSHSRLAEFLPEAKFIFVLRNPVKRAESQYWNEFGKGREWETFEKAISLEGERSKESDYGKLHLNYLERGKYHESLEHFFKHIPQSRVHIVILEKLFKSPEIELKVIAEFLDVSVEEAQNINLLHSNKEEVLALNPKLKGTTQEKLIKTYDRFANAVIVRVTKDKDKKAALRKKYMGFGKVSLREQNKIDIQTLEGLKEYYKSANAKLEALLETDLSIWNK